MASGVAKASDDRPRICLAISSFRNDEEVAALLALAAPLTPSLFAHVIVVDSLATGRLAETIRARGWDWVDYRCFTENLGSAGNLAARLRIGAELGADYVYAVNHDGQIREETVRALLDAAVSAPRTGAAYPLRRFDNEGGRFDLTGTRRFPVTRVARAERPAAALVPVHWSSSNGALYATAPVREGALPRADFWMGWEDVAYGWLLEARGYGQFIVTAADFSDNYEFVDTPVLGSALKVSDKPAWYAYYFTRNLTLLVREAQPTVAMYAKLAVRIAFETGMTLTIRRAKLRRLGYLWKGLVDGFAGRTGMRAAPG